MCWYMMERLLGTGLVVSSLILMLLLAFMKVVVH
jgi:hypothetical protein